MLAFRVFTYCVSLRWADVAVPGDGRLDEAARCDGHLSPQCPASSHWHAAGERGQDATDSLGIQGGFAIVDVGGGSGFVIVVVVVAVFP